MKSKDRFLRVLKASVFVVGFITIVLSGCEKYVIPGPDVDPDKPLYFSTDILPILKNGACASCHPSVNKLDLTAANAYAALNSGGYVSVASPESSKLYVQLVNNTYHKAQVTEHDKLVILTWIQQGAKENP